MLHIHQYIFYINIYLTYLCIYIYQRYALSVIEYSYFGKYFQISFWALVDIQSLSMEFQVTM